MHTDITEIRWYTISTNGLELREATAEVWGEVEEVNRTQPKDSELLPK